MFDALLIVWFLCVVTWSAFMLVTTWHDDD